MVVAHVLLVDGEHGEKHVEEVPWENGRRRKREREERRCQSRSDPASGKSMGGGRACECASVCVFERRGAGYLHTSTLLSAGVGGAGGW